MARADYRLCDVCEGKVFYDANLNYEQGRDSEWAKRQAPFRWAGEEQGKPENDDWLLRLDFLGDWAVICSDCAKTHKTAVVPIEKAPAEPQAEPDDDDALVLGEPDMLTPEDLRRLVPQAEPKHGINWQPIETAPKDNKRPLLLASFDDRGVLSNVDFNGSWECEKESWEMPQEYYFWDSANGMTDEPTHWAYQPEGFANLNE